MYMKITWVYEMEKTLKIITKTRETSNLHMTLNGYIIQNIVSFYLSACRYGIELKSKHY